MTNSERDTITLLAHHAEALQQQLTDATHRVQNLMVELHRMLEEPERDPETVEKIVTRRGIR